MAQMDAAEKRDHCCQRLATSKLLSSFRSNYPEKEIMCDLFTFEGPYGNLPLYDVINHPLIKQIYGQEIVDEILYDIIIEIYSYFLYSYQSVDDDETNSQNNYNHEHDDNTYQINFRHPNRIDLMKSRPQSTPNATQEKSESDPTGNDVSISVPVSTQTHQTLANEATNTANTTNTTNTSSYGDSGADQSLLNEKEKENEQEHTDVIHNDCDFTFVENMFEKWYLVNIEPKLKEYFSWGAFVLESGENIAIFVFLFFQMFGIKDDNTTDLKGLLVGYSFAPLGFLIIFNTGFLLWNKVVEITTRLAIKKAQGITDTNADFRKIINQDNFGIEGVYLVEIPGRAIEDYWEFHAAGCNNFATFLHFVLIFALFVCYMVYVLESLMNNRRHRLWAQDNKGSVGGHVFEWFTIILALILIVYHMFYHSFGIKKLRNMKLYCLSMAVYVFVAYLIYWVGINNVRGACEGKNDTEIEWNIAEYQFPTPSPTYDLTNADYRNYTQCNHYRSHTQ